MRNYVKQIEEKICPVCGLPFKGNAHQYYCSVECRKANESAMRKAIKMEKEIEKRRKREEALSAYNREKTKGKSLSELMAEARAAGMTYGQYIATVEGGMRR